MSRRDNMKRIFVGNLPPDVRTRDLESIFYKFGRIVFIDLKTRRGPPFAFVEFQDYRDAEEAVRNRDGKDFDGFRLRVEFPRGKERPSRFKNGSGSGRANAPQRRSKYRVKVSGLPSSGSWQDLKDFMREIGEVCFADVYKGGEGVVEFVTYDDMRYAIKKLNNTKFKSHEGESSYIKLREDIQSADSRSRSRSPVGRNRRSPSYSPATRRRGSSHSRTPSPRSPKSRRGGDRYESRSIRKDRSVSRSRSPVKRSSSKSSHSDRRASSAESKDRSKSRSRSHSRSTSKSSRSDRRSPSPASRDRSKSRSRSHSRSPSKSSHSDRRASPGSRDRSKSPSHSPERDSAPGHSDKLTSRSPSPVDEDLAVKDTN